MRHLCVVALAVLGAAPLAAAERTAFVWGDQPATSKYEPSPAYAFNPTGKSPTIVRSGAGSYRVLFPGLANSIKTASNVQVSRYGPGSGTCGVLGWGSSGDAFSVEVRCFAADGGATDSQFTLLATWAPAAELILVRPVQGTILDDRGTAAPATVAAPQRRLLADGTVVITYPDGRVVERLPTGGYRTTFPDGSQSTAMFSTGAPVAIPPQAPTDDEALWLDDHAERLLSIIQGMSGADEGLMASYLQSEGPSPSVYQKIQLRRGTIARLIVHP